MVQKLEILVTEDNPKHLADARLVSDEYANISFSFASTLQEAEDLVRQNKYYAVVTDVFFPAQEGEEPTSDSGLRLAKLVDSLGIPFVYNTAGNHHGRALAQFVTESRKIWDNFGFDTGKLIEAYPRDQDSESETKQWNAAFNYAILLARAQELDEETKLRVGCFTHFGSYGDYGKLTETMQRSLDESVPIEDLCRKQYRPYCYWTDSALEQGQEENRISTKWKVDIDWDEERDCIVFLKDTKEADEEWFRETEAKFREEYVSARDYLRDTLAEYRNH